MEVDLFGFKYRIGKMDVFSQWNVSRRLMPVIGSLIAANKEQSLAEMLVPAFGTLSEMSDEDTEYILNKCLAVVHRQDASGNWAKIMGGKNTIMFEDINMMVMIRLTVYVVTENMGDFFTQAASDGFGAAT